MNVSKIIVSRILFGCLFLVMFLHPVDAVSQNSTDVNAAKKGLIVFKNTIKSMKDLANTSLGPFPLRAEFKWCSARGWYCFGCCIEESRYSYKWELRFTTIKNSLLNSINNAESHSNSFEASYAPTQQWINQLPQFSIEFTRNANLINTVAEEIANGIGPNDDQKNRVTSALQKLCDDLEKSKKLIEAGTESLASFLDNQSKYRKEINEFNGKFRTTQQEELNIMMTDCQKNSKRLEICGLLKDQFVLYQTGLFALLTYTFNINILVMEAASDSVEKGVANLLSAVIANNSNYISILKNVKKAKNEELGSWIQEMNLGIAQEQWQKLAAIR